MIKARTVSLRLGPFDGSKTIASAGSAVVNREVYVWDGGDDPDKFTHAATVVRALPGNVRERELRTVQDWMDQDIPEGGCPTELIIDAPPWRVNAWCQLLTYGFVI